MKIFTLCILFTSLLFANSIIKGQTYYQYLLKDQLGYNGAVFAKKHTQKEWLQLFENDGHAFKQFLVQQNSELTSFTKSEKFKKITPFIKDFVLHYAKDVKVSPSCN